VRRFLAIAALLACAPAFGQGWPTKPVRIVVSTGPGLATDLVARALADRLSRQLAQSFVVENIAGAGGNIGAQAVARTAPDGYTTLFTGGGTLVTNQFAFKSMPFDAARDFAPVALVTRGGGFVIAVPGDSPAKSFGELVSHARSQPGKLSYAVDSSNIYGVLLGKLINKTAKMDMVEIPYKSTPQAAQDTMAGRTQVFISTVAVVEPLERSGKLRSVAISGAKRNPLVPHLPTMAETIPGLSLDAVGFTLVAPAATPAEIIQRLNGAVNVAIKEPEFVKQVNSFGLPLMAEANSPADAAEELRQQRLSWGKIYKELGIQPQ
jgi:tripartite-type tricarboxylate transporter receptor subunit TctC